MRIACAGGGPGGLFFALAMKAREPGHEITVYERNKENATHGWGVIVGGNLLDMLRGVDEKTALEVERAGIRWRDQTVWIHGARDVYSGEDAYSISRQRLVNILAARAREVGVRVSYQHPVTSPAELANADLLIAADGAGSELRRAMGEFGTEVRLSGNKYIWLGTGRISDAFNYFFVRTDHGWIWAHVYPFDEMSSTFLVECSPQTWAGLGFDTMTTEDALTVLDHVFAEHLGDHRLVGRLPDGTYARWLNFRTIINQRWHHGKMVLLGDSAHTAHFSLGQGTKLALEDAAALAGQLCQPIRLEAALGAYETQRRAEVARTASEARCSAEWFENVPRYARLSTRGFATLLHARLSPLVPILPPRLSYPVHRATRRLTFLGAVRNRFGPVTHAVYGLREALSRRGGDAGKPA
ncbi:MAG TPA: FAD-dependent monooxygenase [Trebonia sp.]|nr:FAD-dependent monooxygenase [Trebonia sp.]